VTRVPIPAAKSDGEGCDPDQGRADEPVTARAAGMLKAFACISAGLVRASLCAGFIHAGAIGSPFGLQVDGDLSSRAAVGRGWGV
jgi:hypothetical protein